MTNDGGTSPCSAATSETASQRQETRRIDDELARILEREDIRIPEPQWSDVVAEYEILRAHITLVNEFCPAEDSSGHAHGVPASRHPR